MSKAYLCDNCGAFLRGESQNPRMVGDQDGDTWLSVTVHQKGEGNKFKPDLCPDCHKAAVLGVIKDFWGVSNADPA